LGVAEGDMFEETDVSRDSDNISRFQMQAQTHVQIGAKGNALCGFLQQLFCTSFTFCEIKNRPTKNETKIQVN
jgi:hypothetical protein